MSNKVWAYKLISYAHLKKQFDKIIQSYLLNYSQLDYRLEENAYQY